MKIIILAAGKGTRMGELTKNTPKPLLKYEGKNLLEHKFEIFPENTTEVILVIGYLGNQIRDYFGESYNNIPIKYIEQKEMLGTAHALWQCKEHLNEPFMVLMSDDLYAKEDLKKLSEIPENKWALLAYPDKPGIKAGKIVKNSDNKLQEIYEDFDGTSDYNLSYTGVCLLTPEVFEKEMYKLPNGEYGLPQTFAQFAKDKDIHVFETKDWIRITSSEDLK